MLSRNRNRGPGDVGTGRGGPGSKFEQISPTKKYYNSESFSMPWRAVLAQTGKCEPEVLVYPLLFPQESPPDFVLCSKKITSDAAHRLLNIKE